MYFLSVLEAHQRTSLLRQRSRGYVVTSADRIQILANTITETLLNAWLANRSMVERDE